MFKLWNMTNYQIYSIIFEAILWQSSHSKFDCLTDSIRPFWGKVQRARNMKIKIQNWFRNLTGNVKIIFQMKEKEWQQFLIGEKSLQTDENDDARQRKHCCSRQCLKTMIHSQWRATSSFNKGVYQRQGCATVLGDLSRMPVSAALLSAAQRKNCNHPFKVISASPVLIYKACNLSACTGPHLNPFAGMIAKTQSCKQLNAAARSQTTCHAAHKYKAAKTARWWRDLSTRKQLGTRMNGRDPPISTKSHIWPQRKLAPVEKKMSKWTRFSLSGVVVRKEKKEKHLTQVVLKTPSHPEHQFVSECSKFYSPFLETQSPLEGLFAQTGWPGPHWFLCKSHLLRFAHIPAWTTLHVFCLWRVRLHQGKGTKYPR